MANEEHLKILKQGVKAWNKWRIDHIFSDRPDFVEADLSGLNLKRADLRMANLTRANLARANLKEVNLGSLIFGSNLSSVTTPAVLTGANLTGARLGRTNLSDAILDGSDLSSAVLIDTNFAGARLSNTNFSYAVMGASIFVDNDLSSTKGLDTIVHIGPSSIGMDTIYESGGKIPEDFLRGCGIGDEFIAYLPSLIGAQHAIQFYSCFISYSGKDEEFARRLYSKMRDEHLRVWFAPEDMKGGEKLREQIDHAIQVHDRLLIVLSENSLCSKWVETEIRKAHATELKEKRRKLFPIRLASYESLQEWECFDSDTGEDLAREVREYYIPDFSNWKDHDSFEMEFAKLLKDLRAAEEKAEL